MLKVYKQGDVYHQLVQHFSAKPLGMPLFPLFLEVSTP